MELCSKTGTGFAKEGIEPHLQVSASTPYFPRLSKSQLESIFVVSNNLSASNFVHSLIIADMIVCVCVCVCVQLASLYNDQSMEDCFTFAQLQSAHTNFHSKKGATYQRNGAMATETSSRMSEEE